MIAPAHAAFLADLADLRYRAHTLGLVRTCHALQRVILDASGEVLEITPPDRITAQLTIGPVTTPNPEGT